MWCPSAEIPRVGASLLCGVSPQSHRRTFPEFLNPKTSTISERFTVLLLISCLCLTLGNLWLPLLAILEARRGFRPQNRVGVFFAVVRLLRSASGVIGHRVWYLPPPAVLGGRLRRYLGGTSSLGLRLMRNLMIFPIRPVATEGRIVSVRNCNFLPFWSIACGTYLSFKENLLRSELVLISKFSLLAWLVTVSVKLASLEYLIRLVLISFSLS